MKKQYITLDQFNALKLSDHVLFIIDANVPTDYLLKDFEVIKSHLNHGEKIENHLLKQNNFSMNWSKN